jgi:hypothetical protein
MRLVQQFLDRRAKLVDREGRARERVRGCDAEKVTSKRIRDSVFACGCLAELGARRSHGVMIVGELGARCHRVVNRASLQRISGQPIFRRTSL